MIKITDILVSRPAKVLRAMSDDFKKRNLNAYAASAAFFIFISLMPMLAVFCSIIPYTPVSEENLVGFVTAITPDVFDRLASKLIAQVYASASGVLTVSIIITVWTASKGTMAIVQGLNAVGNADDKRNYFTVRLLSCFYMIVMLAAVLVMLLLSILGNSAIAKIVARFDSDVDIEFWHQIITKPRVLYMLILFTLVFALIFTFLPYEKLKYREQLPGAMFSAVSWIIFSFGFSLYTEYSTGLSMIYGSLMTLVIAMLWMYFSMYLLLIGAYLNHYFGPINRYLFGREKHKQRSGK